MNLDLTLPSLPIHLRTFNEKIKWRMKNDRRKILTLLSDKLYLKKYSLDKFIKVPPTLFQTVNPKEINWKNFGDNFVLKANHGSKWNIIVRDGIIINQPRTRGMNKDCVASQLKGRKAKEVQDVMVEIAQQWLLHKYEHGEWAYEGISPIVYVEELLPGNPVPDDLKFFVFHGKVRLCHVDTGRFNEFRSTVYTADWKPLEATIDYPQGPIQNPPRNLNELLHTASSLSMGLDFVRVNLYNIDNQIYLGEMTFYPGAGKSVFNPPTLNEFLGHWW